MRLHITFSQLVVAPFQIAFASKSKPYVDTDTGSAIFAAVNGMQPKQLNLDVSRFQAHAIYLDSTHFLFCAMSEFLLYQMPVSKLKTFMVHFCSKANIFMSMT